MIHSSLGRRIVLIVASGFALAALLLFILMVLLLWPNLKALIITQQQEGVDLVISQIETAIQERIEATENLATMLHDGQKPLPLDEIQATLDARIILHKYYNGGLIYLDTNQTIAVDSPVHPGRLGIYLGDRDYIQTAFDEKRVVLAPPVVGRGLLAPVFIILAPMIADNGDMIGATFGVTRLADENLLKRIGEESLSGSGLLYIVDTRLDLIVTASDPGLALTKSGEAPIGQVLSAIKQGLTSGSIVNERAERVLYASAQIPGMNWQVIRVLPHDEAFAPLLVILKPFVLLLVGLLLILVGATVLLLRRQLAPLVVTANTLDEMVAHKTPLRPLIVERKDEVGRLIEAFNRLSQMRTLQKAKMIRAQNKLQKALQSLQGEVDAAVRKTQEQERIIHDQSRRHALLNLLVNLAHQWRQPLNVTGLLVQQIEEDYHDGQLTDEQMRQRVEMVMDQIRSLSETITNFTELYQSSAQQKVVLFDSIIDRVFELVRNRLKESNLHLDTKVEPGCHVHLAPADLIEVLIQLLENVLIIRKKRNLDSLHVRLNVYKEGAWVTIELCDDAGGFEPALLPTLFDPYTTEGYKTPGRGLGLFHVHEMIVGRYQGRVQARNSADGAVITLKLPAAQGPL